MSGCCRSWRDRASSGLSQLVAWARASAGYLSGAIVIVMLSVLVTWTAGAAIASSNPPAPEPLRDVRYSDRSTQTVLDIYPAPAGAQRPSVILVHGGGWRAGDKSMLDGAAKKLSQAGYVVFNVNYSLGVDGLPGYPMQVGDLRAALRWVEDNATLYGGDPTRIGLAGSSAGGYLAAMVATTSVEPSPLRAVVSLSGPMNLVSIVDDLEALRNSPLCPAGDCPEFDRAVSDLRALTGCMPLRCSKDFLRQASPASHVTENSPPFYLANSSQERVPLGQAREMEHRLRAVGVPVELVVPTRLEHGARYLTLVDRSVLSFLDRNLTGVFPAPAADRPDRPPPPDGRRRWLVPGVLLLLAAVGGAISVIVTRKRALADPLGG